MRKAASRQALQRARNPLLVDALVPRMLMIAVPLEPDLFEIILEPRRAHEIPNLTAQHRELVRIEYLGAIIFLDETRQRRKRSIGIRMSQRRHQMIHDDGMGASLGLCALARIIDD